MKESDFFPVLDRELGSGAGPDERDLPSADDDINRGSGGDRSWRKFSPGERDYFANLPPAEQFEIIEHVRDLKSLLRNLFSTPRTARPRIGGERPKIGSELSMININSPEED